jgi:3-hydroxybutyryl-CoA dehydrogenase
MSDNISNAKVAVVGAGQMGLGIAHAFAVKGFSTILIDVDPKQIAKARAVIDELIQSGVRLGKLDQTAGAMAMSRLSTSLALADCAGADLLVETATERLDLKVAILREAEPLLAQGAIIATNTSALSVSEIAAGTAHPQRVIGMHFFNPVHKMKLIEIVRAMATDDDTVAKTRAYADVLGKSSILVSESPGLTTSRMSAMAGNEAMYMLMEGTASAEDIDTALRLGFNHPMGPLELGDLTGWDTRLSVLRYLHQTLGEKFRPCPLIIKMVASGRVGRKVGHGVYKYEQGAKVPGSGLRASTI